jgi:hypothetical protein
LSLNDASGEEMSCFVDWITVAPESIGALAAVALGTDAERRRTDARMAAILDTRLFSFDCGLTHPETDLPRDRTVQDLAGRAVPST